MITRTRTLLAAACISLLTLLLWFSLPATPIPVAQPPSRSQAFQHKFSGYGDNISGGSGGDGGGASCPTHAPWLADLKVSFPIRYARRDIIVRATPQLERKSVVKLEEPLFPVFQEGVAALATEGGTEKEGGKENEGYGDGGSKRAFSLTHCVEPLVLDVPAWPTRYPNASHMLFGMSTTMERLEISMPYLQRWIAFTNARLVIVVTGPEEVTVGRKEMRALESRMRELGIAATLVRPVKKKDRMEGRYFSLVKLLWRYRSEATRWAVFMDDDTFFPSMTRLLAELEKHDASEQQYLGALSEEWWTVGRYSLMGLGGAGVFLSMPLLEILEKHHKDCLEETRSNAGDLRIYECIKWYGDTRLTHVSGLHQIDLHGDRSGLFESGRNLLSLHHWKEGWWDEGNLGNFRPGRGSWFPMDAMHLVADICAGCFLQRWQFGNDTVLSNGYSIAEYPTGALNKFPRFHGLEKVEQTWLAPGLVDGSLNSGFDHYLGVTRPMLKLEEDKLQYRFLDAVAVDGGVRQYYHHYGLDGQLDTVVELFWIREEDYDLGRSG